MLVMVVFFDAFSLLSFPTRRSSDLGGVRVDVHPDALRRIERTPVRGGQRRLRSEEHTSELQSLRHLVCRLLLEKKKKINFNNLTVTAGNVSFLHYIKIYTSLYSANT